jgi:hypothetical protein
MVVNTVQKRSKSRNFNTEYQVLDILFTKHDNKIRQISKMSAFMEGANRFNIKQTVLKKGNVLVMS